MKKTTYSKAFAIILLGVLFGSCKKEPPTSDCACKGSDSTVVKLTILANGLNNPRGLKFGPDGILYVAEAGIGGTDSSIGKCAQVAFPVGPYLGSPTGGRVSKINASGTRLTVTDKLPSSKANEIIGGDIEGVADVAFIGNTMYAVLAGAGCSHGVPSVPNGVVKINANGSWTMLADLSKWFMTHPTKVVEPADFEPDGTPYSMINVNDELIIIEPNHGDMIKVTANGAISRIVDISATLGHIVPTVVAFHENFYVGNLHPFPIVDGISSIYKITPGGKISTWAAGFNTILGVVFDDKNRLYVLENTVGARGLTPNLGKIIRVDPTGAKQIIYSGLNLPTGITIGPDKNLYVSNVGIGPTAIGGGQILKIEVTDCDMNKKY
jgi:hypothetical protein